MPSQNVLPIDRHQENRFSHLGPDDLHEEEIQSLLDLALRVLAHRHRRGEPLTSPEASRAYLRLKIGERKFEVFACVFLDLCAALRNVELGRLERILVRIRRRQLHISAVTTGASS
jgi:DNA repair protein RadC